MSRASQSSTTDAAADAASNGAGPNFRRERVTTSAGDISYREAGSGPVIVFVHGLIVDGRLWDGVAGRLASSARVIVPDLPMGSHQIPMNPDADLSPPAQAALVGELLELLGLEDVTLVGNDSGGAVSQMLVTTRPERVGRLVLTNCDSFEHFPPFPFNVLPPIARLPGGMKMIAAPFRIGPLRRFVYNTLVANPIDDSLLRSWLRPAASDPAILRDGGKFTAGARKEQTIEAGERLRDFNRPALLAWGADDPFFKVEQAERLAATLPDARLELIEGAKTFVSLDRPERVAELIGEFVGAGVPAADAASRASQATQA